jgi:hypothetical protein
LRRDEILIKPTKHQQIGILLKKLKAIAQIEKERALKFTQNMKSPPGHQRSRKNIKERKKNKK